MKKNMTGLFFGVTLFVVTLFFEITPGMAQEKDVKKQVLNFEDELVEGRDAKPELFFLLQQKKFNYKRLIKLRENFIPEAAQDEAKLRGQRSER